MVSPKHVSAEKEFFLCALSQAFHQERLIRMVVALRLTVKYLAM